MPTLPNPRDIFEQSVIRQANKILSDLTHVLNPECVVDLQKEVYRAALCKYNRYKYSFVPLSMKLINSEQNSERKGNSASRF